MNALSKLVAVEAKLFLREPVSLFFVFALPLGLMLVFGLPQRGAQPAAATGQHGELTFLPSIALSLTIGMLALFTLPMALGIYRERKVLRRLATTPVSPALLLVAQVVVNLVMGVAGAVVTALGVRLLLDQPAPANVPGFVLAFLLGVACLFAIGLLIAALAPSARAAQSIGPTLFFPLLFLAGAWLPRDQMPTVLARIGEYSPLGATVDTISAAWAGQTPAVSQLLVLAGTAVVGCLLATRLFRWE
ncbi:ABC transporter permease [Micromonospora sp. WMMA1998]|uniref:Transport permease protein n=1 Tax=Micromonospora sediminicola TaxID=946078 RepID=A0A1A9BBG0_9ACTN|nr:MULTISPECIES: ABC transporter permease [Micromonospora]ATO13277.1 ABC transporter permease [Micromonospora sp. WMMA2032]PGH45003.1 ABC transporter permease [Micromonospora sp. WMMA1996]WBC15822.1 ABC transporter permease [Micromonospora sp. WMMA1998]SBT66840.1 ABC-2 type transport system permease protein [Micromonospora sediminicola]